MSKRFSKVPRTLKELGEIQVNDWDFAELLQTDLKDLEITKSLRKLGNRKVIDWEVESTHPVINRLANQEIHVVDWVRRAAQYKVIDWDFGKVPSGPRHGDSPIPDRDEVLALTNRLKAFLKFTVDNLIDEPHRVEIRARESHPNVLHFKLLVSQKDVKDLIGRGGKSGAALRNVLKSQADDIGVTVHLQILSHEEELAMKSGKGSPG